MACDLNFIRKLLLYSCTFLLVVTGTLQAAYAQSFPKPEYSEAVSTQDNHYILKIDNQTIGSLTIKTGIGQTLISLNDLATHLKFSFEMDDRQQNLIIYARDKSQLVSLKLESNSYSIGAKTGTWYEQEISFEGDEIYLDSGLLNRLLNLQATVEQSSETIIIRNLKKLIAAEYEEQMPNKPDYKADDTVTAAPVSAVSQSPINPLETETLTNADKNEIPEIDGEDYSPITIASDQEKEAPEDIISKADKEVSTEIEAEISLNDTSSDEMEPLVLQPSVANQIESSTFFEAYKKGDKLYVAFQDLMEFLEFYIIVSDDGNQAKGWFISSQNSFTMNRESAKVTAGNESFDLQEDETLWQDELLFVELKAIEKWLPLNLSFKEEWMQLIVDSDEELPFQLRARRKKQWIQMKYAREKESKKLLKVEQQLDLASLPFVDVSVSQSYSPKASKSLASSYSIQSTGDLGYHTVDSFISGSDSEAVQSARFSARKVDSDGGLLGVLDATEYHFGDINSLNLPLVAQTGVERGFKFTNRPYGYLPEADVKTFVGDATPEWEVELYRNGVLLEFQTVSDVGRYIFEDINVLFGRNEFKLVFYGPQGQVESEVEVIEIGESILSPGTVHYSASLSEKGKTITNLGNVQTAAGEGTRVVASVDVGIIENLSAGAFMGYLPLKDGTSHLYSGISIDALFYNFLISADAAMDLEDKTAAFRISTLSELMGVNLRLTQELNQNLISEVQTNADNLRESNTLFGASTQLYLPLIGELGTNFTSQYSTYKSTTDEFLAQLQLTKTFFGLNSSHRITYQSRLEETLDYNLSLQGRLGGVFWRATSNAEIKPEFEWEDVSLSMQYKIDEMITAQTQLRHNLQEEGDTVLSQDISWNREDYRISLFGQASDEGNYSVGINLGLSFGFKPDGQMHWQSRNMTTGGGVIADIFLDENHNGIHDNDESQIDGALINVNQTINRRADKTMAVPLESYQDTEISLSEGSIENPLWRSSVEGYQVKSLPGKFVKLSFPVVATSEIDGIVMMRTYPTMEESISQNTEEEAISEAEATLDKTETPIVEMVETPVGHMIVQLIDESGNIIDDVLSESDGFYIIDKVLPGTYQLVIEEKMLEEMSMKQVEFPTVKVEGESDFYMDQTIIIEPLERGNSETLDQASD